MRILFFTWRSNLERFAGMVAELGRSGHEVVVASPSHMQVKLPKLLRGIPRIKAVAYDEVANSAFGTGIRLLRNTRDYLWYLSPEQQVASFNRRHALDWLVRAATADGRRADPSWPDPILQLDPDQQDSLDASLAELELRIPPDPSVVDLIRAQRPDAVLVSPLVKPQFHQTEVVKAARMLDVPSGFLAYSWDNLSNKGRVHVSPDRTFVWNELQRQEAIHLHGLDPETVLATGAPHWDAFFARAPSREREDFCAKHSFDPDRPLVLYLGSTGRICPYEPQVVERWLDAVRRGPGSLRKANVLVRRHPDEAARWSGWMPRDEYVSMSRNPGKGDQGLYDELHHAEAVVGLNTTAQLEASILGKPVYTFAAGELAPGQQGTLHFYHLLRDRGGVVSFAETMDEHVTQLERGLAGDYDREAIRRFCESFIRPHGLDRPVTPILAEAVLELAGAGRPKRLPLGWLRARANGRRRASAVAKTAG